MVNTHQAIRIGTAASTRRQIACPAQLDLHHNPELSFAETRTAGKHFGEKATLMEPSTGSEDFSDIPTALGVPYLFWIWGGFDPQTYATAQAEGTLLTTIPGNHAPTFAPVAEPTMRTGITAMTVALLSYLGRG